MHTCAHISPIHVHPQTHIHIHKEMNRKCQPHAMHCCDRSNKSLNKQPISSCESSNFSSQEGLPKHHRGDWMPGFLACLCLLVLNPFGTSFYPWHKRSDRTTWRGAVSLSLVLKSPWRNPAEFTGAEHSSDRAIKTPQQGLEEQGLED